MVLYLYSINHAKFIAIHGIKIELVDYAKATMLEDEVEAKQIKIKLEWELRGAIELFHVLP